MGPFATLAAEMPLRKAKRRQTGRTGRHGRATRRPTPGATATTGPRPRPRATSPRCGARWSGAICRPGRRPLRGEPARDRRRHPAGDRPRRGRARPGARGRCAEARGRRPRSVWPRPRWPRLTEAATAGADRRRTQAACRHGAAATTRPTRRPPGPHRVRDAPDAPGGAPVGPTPRGDAPGQRRRRMRRAAWPDRAPAAPAACRSAGGSVGRRPRRPSDAAPACPDPGHRLSTAAPDHGK